jgi:class 3 adenylate cyclase/tetratricopeptide (TPR) repeat protein
VLVRKTVTVLFCDVVTSTAHGERLDPESWRRVMSRFFDAMRAVIERHGGTVEKFIGDEVMAVFGVPTVHEDDAMRAVRAAAEMRDRLEELNEELEASWGVRLQTRIGVNTGEVVAGDPATGSTFVTGDAVNVGKRLEQAAEPGEILIGKATYPLVRDAVSAGPLESIPAKGKSQPVAPFRLEHVEAGAAGLARRLDTPLVGRAEELAKLRSVFDAAVTGRACHLCTVLGTAGIGKSRLAGELLASLGDHATAVTGRCLPYGEGITFWPLRQIVDGLDLEAVLAGTDDAESIAARVRGTVGASPPAGAPEETFWAVRRFFEALARPRPLVVCLEDIHWAEPTFLDLIEYLAGWLGDAPVLLLCLARADLLEVRPSWASPRADATIVSLDPLSDGEASELLENLRGETRLDDAQRIRIAAAAEGNPLFVEQMLAMVSEQRDVGGELAVPPSIQALLAERLDRLGTAERAVIERASIVGREFPRGAVLDLSPPNIRDDVGTHLLALVRKGLIEPDASQYVQQDGFRFRHALIRDAAYDGIPKEVRADLHARVADWMERHTRDRGTVLDEIRGYHLEQAYRLREQLGPLDEAANELARRAAELLATAGRAALARDDVPAALNLLERAAGLAGADASPRAAVHIDLGSALMKAGEFRRAAAALEEAAGAARGAGDRPLELRAGIERQFLRSFTAPEGAAQEDARVAEAAIPVLEEAGDDLGLAKAWRLLSDTHAIACRWQARADALEHALVHAQRVPEARADASAIVALLAQALHYGPTPAPDAIVRCRELIQGAEGDPALRAGLGATLAALLAMRGEFEDARRLYARSVALYEELGLRFRRAVRTLVGAEIESLAGDLAAAERELRLGYETLDAMGESGVRAALAAFLADVLLGRGDLDEADRFAFVAADAAEADDIAPHVLSSAIRACVLTSRGEVETAQALAFEAVSRAEDTDFVSLRARALEALAEVRAAEGRDDDADELLERALELHEAKGNLVAALRMSSLLAERPSRRAGAAISSPASSPGGRDATG